LDCRQHARALESEEKIMGIPQRNGGGGTFSVSIRPLVKTCPEEAGIGELQLPNGTRIVTIGQAFWPSHDRTLVDMVHEYLRKTRPEIVVMLGGMLHEEAFKQIVEDKDDVAKLICTTKIPEIEKVRADHEGMEERFLALAHMGGEFIASFAKSSGGHVFYIPSVTGMLPNEIDIMRFVLTQKERADKWADKHPEEAVPGPDIPKDFAEFLGLADNPNVTVMPFGSAIRINKRNRFHVGDFRRRQMGSAVQVDVEQTAENVWRGFDGKVSSAWWTSPTHSLAEAIRKYWEGHEIGHLADIKNHLGYIRKYDKRAQGFNVATVHGKTLFSTSVVVLHGQDGRRSFVIDDVAYDEAEATPRAKLFELSVPTPEAKTPAAAPKATRRRTSSATRKPAARKGTGKKRT
jgi:hypothetical protein